jgi:gamma-glutamylcyclotransferase (GGCT)/AIG2-like uncharacterized protein YtfP
MAREAALLYFAYTARIDPDRMAEVCPDAEFQFIAHLPQWGLDWPIRDGGWDGGLPSVKPDVSSTVWGAVFLVPEKQFPNLDAAESEEGRTARSIEAMDRNGKRHQVTTHVHEGNGAGALAPSADYVTIMLDGSRHWNLPAGWIAGLEEHLRAHL